MKILIQIILITLFLIGCRSNKQEYKNYESETLKIERINENVFRHISYLNTKNYGKYPCNGMIYMNGNEAIIFDTPTNNKASSELINWIGHKDVKAVVVTHFHIDCLGGLSEFHSNGVKSFATNQTIQLAKEDNVETLPQNGFENQYEFQINNEVVFAKYFGQGHTEDNIIGFIPNEKTLFGGCLIKQLKAPKGNLADANIEEWPITVSKIKKELPDVEIVIPGHGKNGGKELLDYTMNLFEPEQKYVFFLHNRFLEEHGLQEAHPEFGRVEYKEMLAEFEKNGLTVISEKRNGNVNTQTYANQVLHQIDSLLQKGAKPSNITVVGASKGGYIAQYVSSIANNPELNFVFIGASFSGGPFPEMKFSGKILCISEKSDEGAVSFQERIKKSKATVKKFKEIELHTGMRHGFLFKALQEWITPTVAWAKGNYK